MFFFPIRSRWTVSFEESKNLKAKSWRVLTTRPFTSEVEVVIVPVFNSCDTSSFNGPDTNHLISEVVQDTLLTLTFGLFWSIAQYQTGWWAKPNMCKYYDFSSMAQRNLAFTCVYIIPVCKYLASWMTFKHQNEVITVDTGFTPATNTTIV